MSKGLDKGNGQDPGTYPRGHDVGRGDEKAPENTRTPGRAKVGQTRKRPPKAPTLPHRLHSIEDSARYLGVSPWTLREMIWRNDLPHVKIGRRQYLDIRDLDQFIEQSKTREK